MPDLGDVGDLVDEAKNLVDDHAKEIKQGINQVADVVDDQVSKDQRGTVHDVADAAKDVVNEISGDTGKPKKKATKKATK
ncbi:MAG: hypothetical protein MUP67_09675 [Acidimicrobiia bacterium]|nr:hypothetical protein [Acidimicrobiia bacterium]